MINQADLPEVIPVFPLTGALLLPRSRLPLHLFEPRYLAMLDDALKSPGRLIGMVQPSMAPGKKECDRLQAIGCVGRVTQMSETEDGRYMITLTGISRFRVLEEVDGFTPYRRARISWDGFDRDLGPADTDDGFNRQAFMKLLARYFESRELQTDWDTLKEADDELLINSLSMLLGFEPEDKQALLEARDIKTRADTLIAITEMVLAQSDEDQEWRLQ